MIDEQQPAQVRVATKRRRQPVPAAHPSYDELLARLERLEQARAASQFVESAPDPKPPVHVADLEELTEFQQSLRAQTRETPPDYQRESVAYNFDQRLYAKPDGSIVSLQGDPQNRSYYKDKGFIELTPEQVRQWYGGERQKVIEVQREKADLINGLREQLARDPSLRASVSAQAELAWDHMTSNELQHYLAELLGIPDQHGKPRKRLKLPQRLIDQENRRSEQEAERMLAGVETTPSRTARTQFEALQEQITRRKGGGRTIELTHENANTFA